VARNLLKDEGITQKSSFHVKARATFRHGFIYARINFFFGCIFSVVCVQYYKRVSSSSLSVVPYVFVLLLMMMFWFSSSSSSFSSTCFSKGEE
jgi:hypothetical protein